MINLADFQSGPPQQLRVGYAGDPGQQLIKGTKYVIIDFPDSQRYSLNVYLGLIERDVVFFQFVNFWKLLGFSLMYFQHTF